MRRGMLATVCLVVGMLCVNGSAFGSGFAIVEQSVSGLGNAFAGGAAIAEDASTIFFNPAGMTRIEGQQVVGALHVIVPRADFSGTAQTSAALGGVPIIGSDGGGGGSNAFVPNLYYLYNNPDSPWAYGLGINAPFGLTTEWDSDWVGRYHAVKSDMLTVNINPSIAYKAGPVSLGAGLSAQYVKAELSSAVDFGSILAAQQAPGVAPTQMDGYSVLEADDWSYTYNLGLLIDLSEQTRIGAAYRSQVNYGAKGTASFTYDDVPAPYIPALKAAGFVDGDASADLTLPGTLSLSGVHQLSDRLVLMGDATITFWNSFEELRVKFDGSLPDSVTTYNWENSWRFSLGGTYALSDSLDLRCGVAYDQTPIASAEDRTPRIPDADRTWISAGLGWQFTTAAKLDVAYAHLFVKDAEINKTAGVNPAGEDFFRGDLNGTFENAVDIASVQLVYSF